MYSKKIMREANIDEATLRERVESHLIDYPLFIADDFDRYFISRAKKLLAVIEAATGKAIADKGSEQTIDAFGESLE